MKFSTLSCLLVLFGPASYQAARADSYNYKPLDVPGAASTLINGINNAGQIVGTSGLFFSIFVYSNGAYSQLGTPFFSTAPVGINDSGQIAGNYYILPTANPEQGFLYSDGRFQTINPPGPTDTHLTGINNASEIVGNSLSVGFLYSNGVFTRFIGPPGSSIAQLTGINDVGQLIGDFFDPAAGRDRGFLGTNGLFTIIDVPGAGNTSVSGINDAGQIVGTSDSPDFPSFLYSNGLFTRIDFPGSSRTIPADINNAGQIVGSYTVGGLLQPHGFLATPVPEPTALYLLILGLAAVALQYPRTRVVSKTPRALKEIAS